MKAFVPREKMSKKARRALDSQRRAGWGMSPVTRRVESQKAYSRKRKLHSDWDVQLPFLPARSTTGLMTDRFRHVMMQSMTNHSRNGEGRETKWNG